MRKSRLAFLDQALLTRLKETGRLDSVKARLRSRIEALHAGETGCPTGAGVEERHSGTLVASYNVHKCVGIDGRFDPGRIARVIAEMDADVVAIQEADRRFGRRTGLLDLEALERDTGLALVPTSDEADGHGWHGNALLLRGGSVRRMRRLALPGGEPRGALLVDLDLDAGPLRLVAAHLGLLRRSRQWQVRFILDAIENEPKVPTLLLGDLNEWRPGPRSPLHELKPHFGPLPSGLLSFPSYFPMAPLDRVIGSPGLVTALEVHDTALARVASDHLPLKARIDIGSAREALTAG